MLPIAIRDQSQLAGQKKGYPATFPPTSISLPTLPPSLPQYCGTSLVLNALRFIGGGGGGFFARDGGGGGGAFLPAAQSPPFDPTRSSAPSLSPSSNTFPAAYPLSFDFTARKFDRALEICDESVGTRLSGRMGEASRGVLPRDVGPSKPEKEREGMGRADVVAGVEKS